MSQNDFVLANQSGASYRADNNSALQALASASSGATAPSTTYQFQWWFDTTTNLLKMRNAANTAWVTVASLVGSTWFVLPVLTTRGDLLTRGASAEQRLALGTINQFLVSDGTDPAYRGGTSLEVGAFSVVAADHMTFFRLGGAGAYTVSLPSAATVGAGFIVGFGEHFGGDKTITADGTEKIITPEGDVSSIVLAQRGYSFWLISTGVNSWNLVGAVEADPGAAKAWVNFDGTGTVTIRDSENVTSITDNGVGNYTVNFTTAFADTNYNYVFGARRPSADIASYDNLQTILNDTKTTSALQVRGMSTNFATTAAIDLEEACVTCFGDQ